MTRALCLVFFVSGAAALLFETLWFRQAGLALGNTVWASALVTASFMGGLAIGNALVAWLGPRVRRPLLAYALLEVVVGVIGVVLVFVFPVFGALLAPLLGSARDVAALNALRVTSSFLLLLLPSSAMGATLPLLARALSSWDGNFGRVLGRLYGWNTLGAVAGALGGELLLVEAFGIRGTAFAASALELLAAGAAAGLSRRAPPPPALPPSAAEPAPAARGARPRLCAAAFLAGALLLALEVVWFRFLLLFVPATSLTFAVMLAVVLLGIGLGGLAASLWLHRKPAAHDFGAAVALGGAVAVVIGYAVFPRALASYGAELIWLPGEVLLVSLKLMLPVCFLSGLIFTLLGRALQERIGDETRATGLLTLANTTGAMLGALAAAFLLLPGLGMERSFFVLACGYLVVAAAIPMRTEGRSQPLVRLAAWGLAAAVVVLFPFGLMNSRYLALVAARWSKDGSRVAALKEGLTETVIIFRRDLFGQPLEYRLVTNGIGMSATGPIASRYMGLFVAWPVAVHPAPKSALLICYGLGTTARALTETPGLASIDVVDISRDVLQMSAIVFQGREADPLDDPRVRTHVEDGRFFLLTTRRKYDIITAEPPPPKTAGVVNLYSREYFRLIHDRLAEGGIATYWIPVQHLEGHEARSIIKAFCLAFADCSLWTGHGLEWMLVGSRGARGPVEAERFTHQWRDPVVGARLRAAGLESPAQIGALFLADAATLGELTAGDAPLEDDHPYRLSPRMQLPPPDPFYRELMDARRGRERFARSELARRLWPEAMREPTLMAFTVQAALNRLFLSGLNARTVNDLETVADLEAILSRTNLVTPALWLMGSSVEEVRIAEAAAARGAREPLLDELLAIAALSRRDYRAAERGLARAEPHAAHGRILRQWRILALGLAGDTAGAGRLLGEARPWIESPGADPAPWQWLARRFGLPLARNPT
jgi:predicted membrane-bound spermidine synthase